MLGRLLKGALLSLLCLTTWPVAVLVILACLVLKRPYPDWVVTPDDPVSPFGQYEEDVVTVYRRFGRAVGDLYWLGWRNKVYGLRYRFKPSVLHPEYDPISDHANHASFRDVHLIELPKSTWYVVRGYPMVRTKLFAGFELWAGWKVDRMITDRFTSRRWVNMEGRPLLTIRKAEGQ